MSLSLPALLEHLVVLDVVVAPWLDTRDTNGDRGTGGGSGGAGGGSGGSGSIDESPSVLMQRPWYVTPP